MMERHSSIDLLLHYIYIWVAIVVSSHILSMPAHSKCQWLVSCRKRTGAIRSQSGLKSRVMEDPFIDVKSAALGRRSEPTIPRTLDIPVFERVNYVAAIGSCNRPADFKVEYVESLVSLLGTKKD